MLKKKKKHQCVNECHCYTDSIIDRWYSVKKKWRDISVVWIADDETNYLHVLFTANGYDASFSSASGEFSPINHYQPTRCIFRGGS